MIIGVKVSELVSNTKRSNCWRSSKQISLDLADESDFNN